MKPALTLTQVFLYQQPIEFRKAHQGLCAIIECELGHDPFSSRLYAFTNKRRNKIKYLFWEDNGFVLYYRSLSDEKFKWPKRDDKVMTLTGQQINWLLDGYDIGTIKSHKKLHCEAVF
jgi:transposase